MNEDGGWVRSYRRKWHNAAFLNFRDAAVWSYLYENAAWRDGTAVRVGGESMTLNAGEIAISERFLAQGFCCDRQVIRRILQALENNQMITRRTTHKATHVTICNYSEYQCGTPTEKPKAPPRKTQAKPTANPNLNAGNEEKKEEASPLLTPSVGGEWDVFWAAYPDGNSKKEGRAAFDKAMAKPGVTLAVLLAAIERYKATKPPDRKWAYASTWLNAERWTDEPKAEISHGKTTRSRKPSFDDLAGDMFARNADTLGKLEPDGPDAGGPVIDNDPPVD